LSSTIGWRNIVRMKKDQKTRRRSKLTLSRESVRKLAPLDLSNIAAGAHTNVNCPTITFKCCLTR
jgi:hypothetical protein